MINSVTDNYVDEGINDRNSKYPSHLAGSVCDYPIRQNQLNNLFQIPMDSTLFSKLKFSGSDELPTAVFISSKNLSSIDSVLEKPSSSLVIQANNIFHCRVKSFNNFSKQLSAPYEPTVFQDLLKLMSYSEEIDEHGRIRKPTNSAFRTAIGIFEYLNLYYGKVPNGLVSSDGEAGIHVEWQNEDGWVVLAIKKNSRDSFLYWGDHSDGDYLSTEVASEKVYAALLECGFKPNT